MNTPGFHDSINPCDPVGSEHEMIWLAIESQETPGHTVEELVCKKCGSRSYNTPSGIQGASFHVVNIDDPNPIKFPDFVPLNPVIFPEEE